MFHTCQLYMRLECLKIWPGFTQRSFHLQSSFRKCPARPPICIQILESKVWTSIMSAVKFQIHFSNSFQDVYFLKNGLFFNMKMFLTAIIVNVHIFYHLDFMQLGHAKGLVDFRWTHPVKLKVLSFLPHSFYPAH